MICCMIPVSAYSDESSSPDKMELSTRFRTGYHTYASKGYHGKVSEYTIPDSGFDAFLEITGRGKNSLFSITSDLIDTHDQSHQLNLKLSKFIKIDLSYQKFRHFLDHDTLTNQDFFTDLSPDKSNRIIIEDIKADNSIRLPAIPFLRFFTNVRKYTQKGSRQATTVSKNCSGCHVTSMNQRIDRETNNIALGFEATLKNSVFNYQYDGQRFREKDSVPTADYGDDTPGYRISGMNAFSNTPDFKKDIHKFTIQSKLPLSSMLYASYQLGTRTNRDTHDDTDFTSFTARLSNYLSRFVFCNLFYSSFRTNSHIRNAFERDIEKGGIDMTFRFLKKTTAILTGRWKNTSRDNYIGHDTRSETLIAALNSRPANNLQLHLRYQTTRVRNPFILKENILTREITQTAMPEAENQVYLSLNWAPASTFSLNSSFRCTDSRNSKYNIDEERYEFVIGTWYMPIEQVTLMATFTRFENSISTGSVHKIYHSDETDSLFFYDDVPYDNRSNACYLSAHYRFSPRLAFTGSLTFISSRADFDTFIDNSNIGNYSDIDIRQTGASVGFTCLINKKLTFYGQYKYQKYNDDENRGFTGRYNMISFGLNCTL